MSTTPRKIDSKWLKHQLQTSARTFAIVIRMLPHPLREWIGVCYLIIRAMDDVEDGTGYSTQHRAACLRGIVTALQQPETASSVVQLCSRSGQPDGTTYQQLPILVTLFHQFAPAVQEITLHHCRRIADGMAHWGNLQWRISNLSDLRAYCYVVGGIPGELMVDLFCLQAPELQPAKDHLRTLAVAMWEVLQISNIVRDLPSDIRRGVCFVPLDILHRHGLFDPQDVLKPQNAAVTQQIVDTLVQQAISQVSYGLELIGRIPLRRYGLRLFCSLPLILAVATLRQTGKIPKHHMWVLVISGVLGSWSARWLRWLCS